MAVTLTADERAALEQRCREERQVRRWRRYRAILLLADGGRVEAVAALLDCCPNSVWTWQAAWRQEGLAGVTEAPHAGRAPLLDATAEDLVASLLSQDPRVRGWHTTGWTVPLLHTELERAGYRASGHTIRRTLHRRGWRWKRPKYVLGRPDPAYAEKRGP